MNAKTIQINHEQLRRIARLRLTESGDAGDCAALCVALVREVADALFETGDLDARTVARVLDAVADYLVLVDVGDFDDFISSKPTPFSLISGVRTRPSLRLVDLTCDRDGAPLA